MDRIEILMSLFNPAGRGLEVGAGFNPIVPKARGYDVETVDHATAAELRKKWANDSLVDVSRIEEVDYVCDGASIAAAVGKVKHYDYVLASHVIEHVVDLVGFLKDCEQLLKPDGVLVLAIPDKRRCFDVFGGLSSTGAVLQAHIDELPRHRPGSVFDYYASYALRAGQIGWAGGSDADLSFRYDLHTAYSAFEHSRHSPEYQDIHTWRFTPSSFRLILQELHALGLTGLQEQVFVPGPGVEFYISLSTAGLGCPLDRLTLCKLILAEQYEVLAEPNADLQPQPAPAGIEERMRRLEAVCLHLSSA
jgi:SAM-dependent methyltransferase